MRDFEPYVGPRPFEAQDAPSFIVRGQALQKLADRIRNQHLVILFGPSGSGKTSLIRAGLVPSMADSQQLPNLSLLTRVEDDPFLGLSRLLIAAHRSGRLNGSHLEEQSLAAAMKSGPLAFANCLRQGGYPPERTLIVVDQYEEALFRLSASNRSHFEQTLARAADESGLRTVFVLRSDYLGAVISDGPLSELGPSSLVPLNPLLTIEEARSAIVEPARRGGVAIEQSVVDAIISDLGHDLHPYLLQLVMQQLWNVRSGDRITLADYNALGGVSRLTSKIYEESDARSGWSLSRLAGSLGLDTLSRTLEKRVQLLEETQADYERVADELASVVSRRDELMARMHDIRSEKETNAPRVFVSYAREDWKRTESLYRHLQSMGFSPWIDREDLPSGKEWASEIEKAMHASDFVIICLSNNSVSKRGFVQRELRAALDLYEEIPEGRVFLLPVRFEDCPIPDQLSKFQCTNLFEERGMEKLSRSILEEWTTRLEAGQRKGP